MIGDVRGQTMKLFLVIFLLMSLGLNAYLVLSGVNIRSGGGQHKQSPNEEFTVMANSYRNTNPLSKEKQIYGEITLHRGYIADKVVRRITVSPITAENDMAYRQIEDAIEWGKDGQTATVKTTDFTLTLNVNPEPGGGEERR